MSLSDEEDGEPHKLIRPPSVASTAPRPFTAAEDEIIIKQFKRKQSCRQIVKCLHDRSRMAVNKRLKKLLRIAQPQRSVLEPQSRPGASASSAAAAPQKRVRTAQPPGSKSRWSSEDDAYLLSGGSTESMAGRYGCPMWHVERRKKVLERKQLEQTVHARRKAAI